MSDSDRDITGVLGPGETFQVLHEPGSDHHVVEDTSGRVVARIPVAYPGVVHAAPESWTMGTERRGRGWAVLARRSSDQAEVAGARLSLLSRGYKLWIGRDEGYRVAQNLWGSGWSVRYRHGEIAKLSGFSSLVLEGTLGRPFPLATITTCESQIALPKRPLVILLALAVIRVDALIPQVSTSG